MLWRLIVQYSKQYWTIFVAVVVLQLTSALSSLFLPSLSADLIDIGIIQNDIPYILSVGGLMLAISLLQISASIAAVYFAAKLAMQVGRDLRVAVFTKVTSFSEQELNGFGAGSLITRNTNDVQQIQMLVLMGCTILVTAPLMAVGGIIMALRQDVGLSWLIAAAIPAVLVLVGILLVKMVPLFKQLQKRIDRINQVLREQLSGIRVIRAFVREKTETDRFHTVNDELTDTALRVGRLMAFMFPVLSLIMQVSGVAVIWFGSLRIAEETMMVGTVVAYLQYLTQILMAVVMSSMIFVMVPRAAVSAERIGEVLDTESSVDFPETGVTAIEKPGKVEFKNVSFRYPGAEEPVLTDLSFTCEPGTVTAIIGSTGSGKTTLINLVSRLFDVTEGEVTIGDTNIRELSSELLWSLIALVPQRPYLFSGTVASNLLYGDPDGTEHDMWRTLSTAQAQNFVENMDDGLESAIAQGGTNVSGGQRQRLSIARALMKNSPIIIFDDSFSALDLKTDAALRRALERDYSTQTQIVVAQRVSSIQNADQILVLDNGTIVGIGTHDELLESNSTYQEIVASQVTVEEAA